MEEEYIVFQRDAPYAEWEQESNPVTLEKARAFKRERERVHPDNCYCVMMVVAEEV